MTTERPRWSLSLKGRRDKKKQVESYVCDVAHI
jgi:hypothetical protein